MVDNIALEEDVVAGQTEQGSVEGGDLMKEGSLEGGLTETEAAAAHLAESGEGVMPTCSSPAFSLAQSPHQRIRDASKRAVQALDAGLESFMNERRLRQRN